MKKCLGAAFAVVTIAAALLVAFPAGGFAKNKVLKIGCIMPFSGPYGFYGKILEPGIQVYAELLNKDGGVKIGNETYDIEMVFIDDGADPKRAAQAANELLQKGCVANVGCFSLASPLEAVLTPNKILFVGLLERGFDTNYHKYAIGAPSWHDPWHKKEESVHWIWPEAKKWGSLWYTWHKVGVDEGLQEVRQPDSWFTKAGLSYAEPVYVPMGQLDFTTELVKLNEMGVELVTSGFGPADWALAVKQAHQLGLKFKWYNMGTGGDVEDFIAIAGLDALQVGVAHGWAAPWAVRRGKVEPDQVDMAVRISMRFAKKYKKPMTYMGGFEYGINHLRILLDLYQQAGSLDPDKVMDKARGGTIRDFEGTWTLGGAKHYGGAPVIKSMGCQTGVYQGDEVVYGADNPMPTLP